MRSGQTLTRGDELKVALPRGVEDPPRLGRVGDAALYINRRLEFGKRAPDPEGEDDTFGRGTVLVSPEAKTATAAAPDPQTLKALRSLKRVSWFIVGLLALIFLAMLSRI